ncbi:Sialidase [Trypanosoma melophagium]|uniref:Sialidase n=1 Tax=Trypanosoma melophagium TaxID=715481 RepID=UPI00351A8F79|nr:Sialidase [Trypanosoma melophagium]
MYRSLFLLLLLLLVCCISGYAQENTPQESALPIVQTSPLLLLKPFNVQGDTSLMKFIPEIVGFPLKHGSVTFQGFVGGTGSPILKMKSSTLVFPVQLTTSSEKITSGIMLLRPSDHHWVLGGVLLDEDTYNPAILDWENGKLMMIAQHTSGYQRVYESNYLGETWTESISTLSRVWVNSPVPVARGSQNKFITATIDRKDVILFAQSVVTGTNTELHLWLTDKKTYL